MEPLPAVGSARRIVITGLPGSGKSTLAKRLSEQHGIPHIEVDRFYWVDKKGADVRSDFRSRLESELSAPAWILEGHYRKVHSWIPKPDLILNLQIPLPRLLLRLALRDIREFWRGTRVTSDFVWVVRSLY